MALRNDLGIDINTLGRPIDFSREAFMACTNPRSHYFTLGAPVWKYLGSKGWSELPREKQWELFDEVLKELNGGKFFIVHMPSPSFSVLSGDGAQTLGSDVLRVLTAFYRSTVKIRTLDTTRKSALAQLGRRMKAVQASLREAMQRKHELSSADEQARWADLIMAHLHAIPKGAASVSLPDFDGGTQVTIPLKKDLDPQRNAERYYRRSKNRKLELGRVEELIASRKQELDRLSGQQSQIQGAQSEEELGHALRLSPADNKKGESKPLPYFVHEFRGYRILVGRNAASNETLTTKVAAPNDEWLHARDCAGSHVVVRSVGGKVTPAPVIERAAELAAWHSKRRHESLCPVIVTKKKYVRKRKGSAPGEVVVEREKVIFVTPAG
jgi:predicted ribosome quality control (RQC) complex YloA/Tae2 family protein